MHNLLLALHVLFAVFTIGPLVHAATTASRGIRTGDAAAAATGARMARIYAYASLLVAIFGMSLVQSRWHVEFSDTWVWLSLVLWLVGVGLVLGVLAPTLDRAGARIQAKEPVGALTARAAASGGTVGLIFAVIVFLMVYQPGG